jgi:acetylornithine deacetylase/succinyl-diaminopimelate desuccinylase-like protein
MSTDSNFPVRKLISRRLDAFSFDVELIKAEPRMVNILGTLRGSGGGCILLFDGHYDIVPIGNIDFWSVDPFEGAVKGGGSTAEELGT